MQHVIEVIVQIVDKMGYFGIVAAMFLESSFFPFPSEVIMPPAGYLASQGKMDLWIVILMGIIGSILGALFNYWLSLRLGRPLILRFGKYIGLTSGRYYRAEQAYRNHGEVTTFVGRLIPGLRQYISLPAGLARMSIARFVLFTGLGAAIWASILSLVGYIIGDNQELVTANLRQITIYMAGGVALIIICYVIWHLRRRNKR
jgi:membrane protein DedA with SNARE-associated domain